MAQLQKQQRLSHLFHFRRISMSIKLPAQLNETETKLKQYSSETILKLFCFGENKTPWP